MNDKRNSVIPLLGGISIGSLVYGQSKAILYAGAFDATTSKTVDVTITPYATSESFVRALAVLEI